MKKLLALHVLIIFVSCNISNQESKTADSNVVIVADVVYQNGKIYTGNEQQKWAEAVAIAGDRFVFVGDNESSKKYIGDETVVFDLDGKFAMPGLYDMHCHPDLRYGPKIAGQVMLTPDAEPEIVKQELLKYAAENPDKEWIMGEAWQPAKFEPAGVSPGRDWLDSFLPDRPVGILDNSRHILMMNSKALEITGIDENTFEPDHGIIHKDPQTGRLTGLLQDGAQTLPLDNMPKMGWQVMEEAYRLGVNEMNSLGIIAARANHQNTERLKGMQVLERNGELTVRFEASISWKNDLVFTVPDRAELLSGERFRYRSKHLNPNFIKFHFDGSFGTAYFLKPYEGDLGKGGWRGNLNLTQEELVDVLVDMDRRGIGVIAHAIGDAGVRHALNAMEEMRKINGMSDVKHTVAHTMWIHPDDLDRFKPLNITAEVGGYIWEPTREDYKTLSVFVGEERMGQFMNFRGLIDAGARPCVGSDWPVSPTPDPWGPMRDLVDRVAPGKSITIEEAIRVWTRNGAYAMGIEDEAGSIEAGKFADFIVLDRSLLEATAKEIGETKVLTTVFEGKPVYEVSK